LIIIAVTAPPAIALALLFGSRWLFWVWLVILPITMAVITLVPPLFTQRDQKSYVAKLRAADWERRSRGLRRRTRRRRLFPFFNALLVIVLAIAYTAWGLGSSSAAEQTVFFTTTDSPPLIVTAI